MVTAIKRDPVKRIGVFDSGIGGFSILRELFHYKDVELFYVSDAPYGPYGQRDQDYIVARSKEVVDQLLESDVDLVVVACNTATAWAISKLRETFSIPIVGIEPYTNFPNKHGIDKSQVALITTEATQKAEKFIQLQEKIDPKREIFHHVTPYLASHVERVFGEGMTDEIRGLIEAELRPLKEKGYKYLILGCTHYPLVREIIDEFLELETVCPGWAVASRVQSLLDLKSSPDAVLEFKYKLSTEESWTQRRAGSHQLCSVLQTFQDHSRGMLQVL